MQSHIPHIPHSPLSTTIRFPLFALFAAILFSFAPDLARAQDSITYYLRTEAHPFPARHLNIARNRLDLSDEQYSQARDLWEGTNEEILRTRIRLRRKEQALQFQFEDGNFKEDKYTAAWLELTRDNLTEKVRLEESMLSDLRSLLTETQTPNWDKFLRDRRIECLKDSSFIAWPTINDLLDAMKLSDAELDAIQEPLEEHLTEFDTVVKSFLAQRKVVIALNRDKPDGDHESERAKLRTQSAAVRESILKGIRSVGSKLPFEKAQDLQLRYEEMETARLSGWTKAIREEPFRDYLAISSLTKTQKNQLEEIANNLDRRSLRLYSKHTLEDRNRMLGLPDPKDAPSYDWEKFSIEHNAIRKEARTRSWAVLTDAQKKAYTDGTDIPTRRDNRSSRFGRDSQYEDPTENPHNQFGMDDYYEQD